MSIKQTFSLAFKSLLASKTRSILTMLGIIIGIAAVIILVGVMGGVSNEMTSQFSSFGANQITLTLFSGVTSKKVGEADIQEFVSENLNCFAAYSPTVSINGQLKNGTENTYSSVSGVNEYYDKVGEFSVSEGRFLQYIDCEYRKKVCVIGTYQVDELFEGVSPLGESLKINGTPYTIVGIVEETADRESGSSDDAVYIPYTTAMRASGNTTLSSYTFNCSDSEIVYEAKALLEDFLLDKLKDADAYYIFSFSEILDSLNVMMGILTGVLVGIASISLVVSGVGVMNIMVVTVTERTREIGIRKALGAKKRHILSQFVVEAAVTSAIGGVIGIIFGILLASPVGSILGVTSAVSLQWILIAFTVSAAIGIIFGYFPARRAANMNPIDALRYD